MCWVEVCSYLDFCFFTPELYSRLRKCIVCPVLQISSFKISASFKAGEIENIFSKIYRRFQLSYYSCAVASSLFLKWQILMTNVTSCRTWILSSDIFKEKFLLLKSVTVKLKDFTCEFWVKARHSLSLETFVPKEGLNVPQNSHIQRSMKTFRLNMLLPQS